MGRCAHMRAFFAEPVAATDARKLCCALSAHAVLIGSSARFKSYDRLFPRQGSVPIGGFGNAICVAASEWRMS
ncbi:TOTE conflict system archaeo-eukaryotic primase domain-containing protein [Paraeggerthella sp. LCP19S3_G8]|uniref:TOTE conflict system archaeo-eukaryotic primase domain-containing protein n=1 Tax=Paraeggerthella sp. LCP19S3_G8 TaxID=3440248 RepID=UPI003F9D428B